MCPHYVNKYTSRHLDLRLQAHTHIYIVIIGLLDPRIYSCSLFVCFKTLLYLDTRIICICETNNSYTRSVRSKLLKKEEINEI